MKLLLENWRQYLTEEEMRTQIITYLEENNIVLTEAELEEAMPRWMKKLGTGAALAAVLAGGGARSQAYADTPTDADAPAAQAEAGQIQVQDENGDTWKINTETGDATLCSETSCQMKTFTQQQIASMVAAQAAAR